MSPVSVGTKKSGCSVAECADGHKARGLCAKHYKQWRKLGDPLGTSRLTIPERLAKHTRPQGECLIWTGSCDRGGYGNINIGGRTLRTHRVAWAIINGELASDQWLDHRCHERKCLNVAHLRVVDNKQNQENRSGLNGNNKSGFRNVFWDNNKQTWVASVKHHGVNLKVGKFASAEEASVAAERKRKEIFTHASN